MGLNQIVQSCIEIRFNLMLSRITIYLPDIISSLKKNMDYVDDF